MELELDERSALICFGFLALGLGYLLGRSSAEADFLLQAEEFKANGGKIIPPEPKQIEITTISVEPV